VPADVRFYPQASVYTRVAWRLHDKPMWWSLSRFAARNRSWDSRRSARSWFIDEGERRPKMTESLINEWLADCKDVSPSELHTFANTLSQDNEIVRALYVLLEERTKYSEVQQRFSFIWVGYIHNDVPSKRFAGMGVYVHMCISWKWLCLNIDINLRLLYQESLYESLTSCILCVYI